MDELDHDDEPEPECECQRIDVDLDDTRYCPLHGPNSEMAKWHREREAAAEVAYWSDPGWAKVFEDEEDRATDPPF